MSPDKIMRPQQQTRKPATARQVKSGIIEGPVAKGGNDNLTPYNRGKK